MKNSENVMFSARDMIVKCVVPLFDSVSDVSKATVNAGIARNPTPGLSLFYYREINIPTHKLHQPK